MRRNYKKRITVFALAAVMATSVAPAVPSSAGVVQVSEVSQLSGIEAAGISLKETQMSRQAATSWTFNYNNDALAESKYKITGKDYSYDAGTKTVKETAYESTEYTFKPTMSVLVFDKGDRTKPVKGSMIMDETGKYVVDKADISKQYTKLEPGVKYEFTINAGNIGDPGAKEVVGYVFKEPEYLQALRTAQDMDRKEYCDAYKTACESTAANVTYPDEDDYKTHQKAISKSDYYIITTPVDIEVIMEAGVRTKVTSTSVELDMSANGADGYELYRYDGKKYIKIATVAAAVYTDKGLVSNTTYSYKVRPYYRNVQTDAITYGKYSTIEATTAGSALNLKAKVNKKNKVELTWKKVTGVTKYEIYRVDTTSGTSVITKGDENAFSTMKLIATVKKSKKKYTDKTVKTNRSYSYVVRAVLTKNKNVKKDKQRYVTAAADVSIAFGDINVINNITAADGSVTLQWDKVYGADGYVVEKKEHTYEPEMAFYNEENKEYPYVYGTIDPDGAGPMTAGTYIYYSIDGKNYFRYYIDAMTKIAYPTQTNGEVIADNKQYNDNGEYYDVNEYNASTSSYETKRTLIKDAARYKLDDTNGYVADAAGEYVVTQIDASTKQYKKLADVLKYSVSSYPKDNTGKEKYEYAIDTKGFYRVEWKTDSIKQTDGTYKHDSRIITKTYVYVLDGANLYNVCDPATGDIKYKDTTDWKEVTRLGKNTTSYKFEASTAVNPNKEVVNKTEYQIKAYKGTSIYGAARNVTTTYTKGLVSKVTATKTDKGIKITWTPVTGAAYYNVYRVKTKDVVNNKDIGGYYDSFELNDEDGDNYYNIGTPVTNYVGITDPVAIDVAAWNKTVDESIALRKTDYEAYLKDTSANKKAFDESKYLSKDMKLNDKHSYHYQNYSYATSVFTDTDASTGILDYAGKIYSGNALDKNYKTKDNDGNDLATPVWEYNYNPVVDDTYVKEAEVKAGVSYTYYVVAHFATPKTVQDYRGTNVDPKDTDDYFKVDNETRCAYNTSVQGAKLYKEYGVSAPSLNFKDPAGITIGVKTVGSATFTTKVAANKPAIKSVKASKGKVTVAIKKKIANADYYKVYRSTKKKGKYTSVGVTKNAKTLKVVDNSTIKGKTYYYKIVSVVKNETLGEVESKASAIKKVKAK